MKTILHIALVSAASILSGAAAVHAQNPVIGRPDDPSNSPATNPQSSKNAKADAVPTLTPADDAARGDAYYYFTIGHLDEQQYEATGKPELAIRAEFHGDYGKARGNAR